MTAYMLLILFPLALGLYAQFKVSSAFRKYKTVAASSGITGARAAQEILRAENINDVQIEEINGMLGDHYDPVHKKLCLSTDVYHTPSIAALGIAAHECGHAIQHARAYAPLKWRMTAVPVTQFASQILPIVILGGIFFQQMGLITVGIVCYAVLALFQLITLPVEFDASSRAKEVLSRMGMVQSPSESAGVGAVLNAAALTYVAAFIAALGNLVYLLLIRRAN
jgi:Zn-dependent membrane protease YugP